MAGGERYKDSFTHYIVLFEQLAKKDSPDILLLSGEKISIYHSHKTRSGWLDKRINVWGKEWIETNESLPSCYTNKDEVIKRTASFPWLLGDLEGLIDLHTKGILTPEYYEEIKVFWERVSPISLDTLRKIAYGTYQEEQDAMQ